MLNRVYFNNFRAPFEGINGSPIGDPRQGIWISTADSDIYLPKWMWRNFRLFYWDEEDRYGNNLRKSKRNAFYELLWLRSDEMLNADRKSGNAQLSDKTLSALGLEMTRDIVQQLIKEAPVMSGNLRKGIKARRTGNGLWWKITISGKSYDVRYWLCTKRVRRNGKLDYALWLNEVGAFGRGRRNKSKSTIHWVDKILLQNVASHASKWKANVVRGRF